MTTDTSKVSCNQAELVAALALGALPANQAAAIEGHVRSCAACRDQLESMRSVVAGFSAWPADVLKPASSLWDRLAERIGRESGARISLPALPDAEEPDWEQVAPGIACKLLATDRVHDRVSMLVRLAPGAAYPPHTHAGLEELHLLNGELDIDNRKLFPGDYNRAEAGSTDRRVYSETGCTCVLITSTGDRLL